MSEPTGAPDAAVPHRPGLGGYPVNLLVAGRSCVVVGGGPVAARKAEALLDAGAVVHVVAPDLVDDLSRLATAGRLVWHPREFRASDLDGAWLATAATDDPTVNHAVFEAGEARRVWVNAADDPQRSSCTLPATLRRGDLVVTIGTGGRSPALAVHLRDRLRDELGPEYAVLLDVLAEARDELRARGRSSVDGGWQRALDSDLLELLRDGRVAEAKELLRTCLSSSSV